MKSALDDDMTTNQVINFNNMLLASPESTTTRLYPQHVTITQCMSSWKKWEVCDKYELSAGRGL
jgi:hypothetical protein